MDEKTNINQGDINNATMNFSDEECSVFTDNMFFKIRSKQGTLAKALHLTQPTFSQS